MTATQQQPPTPFELDVEPERDVVRVCPAGELDLATVPLVRSKMEELASSGFPRVFLDLREATFLDSAGVHLILDLDAAARDGGWEFAVIDGSPEVGKVFDVTGVRPLIPFLDPMRLRNRAWR